VQEVTAKRGFLASRPKEGVYEKEHRIKWLSCLIRVNSPIGIIGEFPRLTNSRPAIGGAR
jgi:hypothetical protein